MGKYLPYAGTNAIQEVIVGIGFQGQIPQSDLSNVRVVAEADLKEDFPRLEEIIGTQVRLQADQGVMRFEGADTSHQTGFNLLSIDSDGKPSRTLEMSGDLFTLHFMRYAGWEKTLEDSIRYISTILPRLNLEKNGLQSFTLRYIDRFTFDGKNDDANAARLFNKSSEFISRKCFDAGPYWHCHSGWFDQYGEYSRILNQLNIGSAMVDNASTITIDHNMMFRPRVVFNTVDGFMQSVGGGNVGLNESLDYLHSMNHDVLTGLLRVNAARQIGLIS